MYHLGGIVPRQTIKRRLLFLISLSIALLTFTVHGQSNANASEIVRSQLTPCPNMLAPRLVVGELAKVIPGNSVNIRDKPTSVDSQTLGKMVSNDVFLVVDGPQCSISFTWWKVNFNGLVGWAIEANGKTYVLEGLGQTPVPPKPTSANVTATPTMAATEIESAGATTQPTVQPPTTEPPTAGPSPTPSATFTVTPIPTSPIGVTCPNALPSRLIVGDKGKVRPEADQNQIRENPNSLGTLVGYIPVDGVFLILEGPTCADDTAWYKVSYQNFVGWVAESKQGNYNLAPIAAASNVPLCKDAPVKFNAPKGTASGNAEIVYIDPTNNVALVSLDGRTQKRLTTNSIASNPVWSPDGSRIALVWRGHIAMMNADGSDLKEISAFEGNSPSWSPDGGSILFASEVDVTPISIMSVLTASKAAASPAPPVLNCNLYSHRMALTLPT